MQKIITAAEKLRLRKKELSEMIVCDTPKKSDHCLNNCFHGKPHSKDTEKDGMCHTKLAFCYLSYSGILKVKCRTLSKKQIEEYL